MAFSDSDRILVVGGGGFIGRHLIKRCLKDTRHIACLGLNNKGPVAGIETINADLSDRSKLSAALSNRTFDYVFNLGGYIDHTSYFSGGRKLIESHFTGLMNLIDCLDIKALKGFVQAGSSDEYGGQSAPQKETTRESPISPYSFAKTAATHFIQTLSNTEGFPGTVLRFFLVYGPEQDDRRFLPQIIRGCLANDEFKTSEGGQLRDFCFVEDVVEAMVMAALCNGARGHVINIASGRPVSIREMILKVIGLAGGGRPLWGAHPYRTGENMELYADTALAKSLLSWEASTSLDEGLKRTVEYYKQSFR